LLLPPPQAEEAGSLRGEDPEGVPPFCVSGRLRRREEQMTVAVKASPPSAFGISAAARYLEISESYLRKLEASGQLEAERLVGGQRVFRRKELERFAAERAARKAAAD
jgi:excisionase family DNA binding protein